MSNRSLQQTGTHITKLQGKMDERTDFPDDTGPAGLKPGRRFYNTAKNEVNVRSTSTWRTLQMTTTSTTTS